MKLRTNPDTLDHAEDQVEAAATTALGVLADTTLAHLEAANWTTDTLDNRWPEWRAAVADLQDVLGQVYLEGWQDTLDSAQDQADPGDAVAEPVTAAAPAYPLDPDSTDYLPGAQSYVDSTTNRLVQVADTVFDSIRTTLIEGLAAGESIDNLAATISKDLANHNAPQWRNRARVIARTEAIGANNAGGWAAASYTGSLMGYTDEQTAKQWLATHDDRTRPNHAIADSQVVVGLRTPFVVGGEHLQHPGDPNGSPGNVIQCVVGSTQVEWPREAVHAITRSTFHGTLVELVTAAGHRLTVTPNHPILTPARYLPAEALGKGDHVLATRVPVSPQVQHAPPRIEEVYAALAEVGVSARVPSAHVDFHGDRPNSEVEIVRPDRDLSLIWHTDTIQRQRQLVLANGDDRTITMSRHRPGYRGSGVASSQRDWILAPTPTPDGLVGGSSKRTTFDGTSGRHPNAHRLTPSPDGEVQLSEVPDDSRATDSEATRHLEDAYALGMEATQIVEVNRLPGDHAVYNLHTSAGYYIGNGILQHNCRCSVAYLYPGDPDYPQDLDLASIDDQAADAAQGLYEHAASVEPGITEDMRSLVDDLGGYMEGLDFRLKTEASLSRKIAGKIAEGQSVASATADISDAVRYTGVFAEDVYAASAQTTVDRLVAAGYSVRVKNTWGSPKNPYRGINLALEKGGQKVELQLHTPDSFASKMGEMHSLYERYRVLPEWSGDAQRLSRRMFAISNALREPPGSREVSLSRTAAGILAVKEDDNEPRRPERLPHDGGRAPPVAYPTRPHARGMEPRHTDLGPRSTGQHVHRHLDQQPSGTAGPDPRRGQSPVPSRVPDAPGTGGVASHRTHPHQEDTMPTAPVYRRPVRAAALDADPPPRADYTDEQWAAACLINTGDADTPAWVVPVLDTEGDPNSTLIEQAAADLVAGIEGATEAQTQEAAEEVVDLYAANDMGDPPADLVALAEAPDADDDTGEPTEDQEASGGTWHGTLMVEDTNTGDGRRFASGSTNWPDPGEFTIPLKWQAEESFGHEGSVVVGSIDTIERVGNEIQATGRWHDSEEAQSARSLVRGGFSRGVSVDVDAAEARFVDEHGEEVDFEDALFADPDETTILMEVTSGRIRAATLCAIPAFVEAQVYDDEGEVAVAEDVAAAATTALTAAAVQALPDPAWFRDPALSEPTPFTMDGDRIYGHLATWGTCHIGYDGVCVTPPTSAMNYGYFATGSLVCEDGTTQRVGSITMGTGHAAPSLRARPAAEHYDNTGSVVADVAIGEDEHGIWFAGALRPEATGTQRAQLAASGSLSGDWRDVGGGLELVAALVVNVPGFPIPRQPAVAASAGRQMSLVAAGRVDRPTPSPAMMARQVRSIMSRERRVERVQARMRRTRAAMAAKMMKGVR